MPSNHLVLCLHLLLPLSIFPGIRVFSNESVLHIRSPKYWSFSFSISSVQFSHSVVSDSLQPHESQHTRPPVHHQLPEFTQTHVRQVSDALQPSHPLSSPSPPARTLQASGSLPMSQFFASDGQNIGVPMNIED